MQSQR